MAGADINHTNGKDDGRGPIHYAHPSLCGYGRRTMCSRVLLAAGCDVNLATTGGLTTPLLLASYTGHLIPDYVRAGADLNAADNVGCTPLMNAVLLGRSDIASSLISSGCDVNRQDRTGKTALFYATGKSCFLMDMLLSAGADVTIRDDEGQTAVELASQDKDGCRGCIEALREAADIQMGRRIGSAESNMWTLCIG